MNDTLINRRTHDLIHQQLGLQDIKTYNRDLSCSHCYPPEDSLSIEFHNFWTWISNNFLAISYTSYTQQFFEEIFYTEEVDLYIAIRNLLFSIRYADLAHIDYALLRQSFINEYSVTSGFQPNPDEYHTSPELNPNRIIESDSDSLQEFESLPNSPDTSDSEDLHLDLLFQQLLNNPIVMAQP